MKRALFILISVLMLVGCKKNQPPVIINMSCSPDSRSAGTVFTFLVLASDEDGDKLHYLWSADGGEFLDSVNQMQVRWKSPANGAGSTFTVRTTVSDNKDETVRDFPMALGEAHLGILKGQVNYTNFKIPVSGAIVSTGDQSTTSDASGNFIIEQIPVGDYTVKVTKTDFNVFQSGIKIIMNDTTRVLAEITSVNGTTKLSGMVADQSGAPLEGVTATALNPDGTESKLKSITDAAGLYRLWYIPFGKRTIQLKKATTQDYSFATVKQVVDCDVIENQINLVMQRTALRGQFTDRRDNHVYQYKIIGNDTWMAENLAYLPKVDQAPKRAKQDPYYYVYDYMGTDTAEAKATSNYKQFGVLYNLPAALAACPDGWHLPNSESEWTLLEITVGMPAGKKLKATSTWSNHGIGDNSSGFSALPGGKLNDRGEFVSLEDAAYFWTASFRSYALTRVMTYDSEYVYTGVSAEETGLSVRCVKDR